MKQLGQAAQGLSADDIKAFLIDQRIALSVDSREIVLTNEEMEVIREEKEGYGVDAEGPITVVLDIGLTPELVDEGFARELVNKIQNMRKSSGFEVTDRISIRLFADEPLAGAADRYAQYICDETLADSLDRDQLGRSDGDDAVEWKINGEKAVISVSRV
jgi:isoleucyl-tRNA synthetase